MKPRVAFGVLVWIAGACVVSFAMWVGIVWTLLALSGMQP